MLQSPVNKWNNKIYCVCMFYDSTMSVCNVREIIKTLTLSWYVQDLFWLRKDLGRVVFLCFALLPREGSIVTIVFLSFGNCSPQPSAGLYLGTSWERHLTALRRRHWVQGSLRRCLRGWTVGREEAADLSAGKYELCLGLRSEEEDDSSHPLE